MPNWVAHSYALSCIIQTILLTGALAVRLRAAEALNRRMQSEALSAAQAAEQRATMLVQERTRELALAKQVAEDALRAELASKEQQVRFMEVISHQYRTPLAAIRSHVDNIRLSLPKGDLANHHRIDRIRRGIARLVEVLEVNLSRSRLQGPSFQPELVSISPAAVTASALARARDLLKDGIKMEISAEVEKARIMADTDMLEIAIINLLENAVKFSRSGVKAPVYLRCRLRGAEAEIHVEDKGIGIPSGEIETIQQNAVRGSNAQSIEGTGTGLSLVRRIVLAHGGSIRVESKEGEGTIIRMYFPLHPDPQA
ncbi:ATP-binding protein [Telmatospirillum sp. J64-1]|uniref:ATP-binding protein n=1 Tax=Telmatospirillum sp. J64-1 TaxID=2502183 RepID=UPI00115C72E8|nr:ATP-binding protein [Telmatospirillum sp. J64-1]